MNKKEVKALSNEALIVAFYDVIVVGVKEANSVRGETKKTAREEDIIISEIASRFGLDKEAIVKGMV